MKSSIAPRNTPFFDPATGKPVRDVYVVSKAERDEPRPLFRDAWADFMAGGRAGRLLDHLGWRGRSTVGRNL